MPFLAPLVPALVGGIGSAAAGAGINAISQGLQGNKGAGFQAQSAPIQAQPTLATPVSSDQTSQAQQATQAALQQQQGAVGSQQALAAQLAATGGIGNQASVYGQQQALANQLGQMAQGAGPNPAQAQLAQNTAANQQAQAAMMASQRGAGANAGLLARQAAQQEAGIQQQAVGQEATLAAQQQLAAINSLQQQQGMLGNLATTQVGQQMAGTGAATGAAQNLTAAQQAQQQALLGQTNIQNSQALQATQAANQANLSNVQQQNAANSGIAQTNANNTARSTSGLASGIGTGIAAMMTPATPAPVQQNLVPNAGGGLSPKPFAQGGEAILKETYKGQSKVGSHLFAKGGKSHKLIDALVSPGEKILTPEQAKKAKAGKMDPMKAKTVPGKPKVDGAVNSYANDTVPKKLAEGSVVLPRTVTQAPDDKSEKAKKFVATLKSKSGKKS